MLNKQHKTTQQGILGRGHHKHKEGERTKGLTTFFWSSNIERSRGILQENSLILTLFHPTDA